jgi:hypothetical protein
VQVPTALISTASIRRWDQTRAVIEFSHEDRRIRFVLPLPDRNARQFAHTPTRGTRRTDAEAYKAWEQACRQRWRALALAIKAKLEAVEAGITDFQSKMALDAGVAERQVRVAEAQGELLASVIKAILGDLGLSKDQQAVAPGIVRRHLIALAG